jgi:hypothetical protein
VKPEQTTEQQTTWGGEERRMEETWIERFEAEEQAVETAVRELPEIVAEGRRILDEAAQLVGPIPHDLDNDDGWGGNDFLDEVLSRAAEELRRNGTQAALALAARCERVAERYNDADATAQWNFAVGPFAKAVAKYINDGDVCDGVRWLRAERAFSLKLASMIPVKGDRTGWTPSRKERDEQVAWRRARFDSVLRRHLDPHWREARPNRWEWSYAWAGSTSKCGMPENEREGSEASDVAKVDGRPAREPGR